MGELDDKETTPAAAAPAKDAPEVISIDEPKETEKLLTEEKPAVVVKPTDAKPKPTDAKPKPIDAKPKPTDAKPKPTVTIVIEKPASNGTPKKKAPVATVVEIPEPADEPKAAVTKEGREVKPKKIPIGGIKMPGFFTKSKPKPEGDGADGELLEKNKDTKIVAAEKPTEAEAAKNEKPAEEKPSRMNIFNALKIRNPFAKREPVKTDDAEDAPSAQNDSNATDKTAVVGETANPPPRKGLLNAIRLPIVNIIPKKLRSVNNANHDSIGDLESGNGPKNKAGLASMETLDDPLKDAENNGKDVTDKAAPAEDTINTNLLTVPKRVKKKKPVATGPPAAAATAPVAAVKVLAQPTKTPAAPEEDAQPFKCEIDDWAIIIGLLLFMCMVGIIALFTLGDPPLLQAPIRDGKYVEAITSCGSVEGIREDSAFAFRGIPYAYSPIGDRRFKNSEIFQNIDKCWNGTMNAHHPTPVCWQKYANGSIDGIEDCLTLDVISPIIRYDNPLPVVLLIGAESFLGDSPGILRPSARYSRARDVVFVRPNFRMGALGLLSLNTLSSRAHPPTSGNYALSDVISALKWIQLNIVHFGGNPREVTIFGHRAGATIVTALITSKNTQDLFSRAWVTSGSAILPVKPLPESERANAEYEDQVSCKNARCLLDKDCEELFEAIPDSWHRVSPDLPAIDENSTSHHEWLVMDGNIVKKQMAEIAKLSEGFSPIVYGTTKHESHSEKLLLKHKEWTPELVKKHIEESKIGQLGLTEEALKRYSATYAGLVSMITDIRTICPMLIMAREQQAAFYVVTQVGNGDNPLATVDDDVQAILGRYEPKTPEQRRYVSAIQQLFYYYVSQGEVRDFEIKRPVIDIGQDASWLEDYPNCNFWISVDVVPRFAHID